MQWAVGSNVTNLYSTWRNLSGVRAGTELLPPGLIADPVGVVGCDDIELASNELSGGFCSAVGSSVECPAPLFCLLVASQLNDGEQLLIAQLLCA